MDFGVDISGRSVQQGLDLCGADWEVSLVDAAACLPDGTFVPVPGYKFVVAGGEPVGHVGSRYHPVQNAELLEFAGRVADRLGVEVSRAGVTQGNRRFWCWVPLEGTGLLVSTAHHGRGAISMQLSIPGEWGLVRVGPESESTLSFPHGPTLQARLDDPSEVAGWANSRSVEMCRERDRLRATVLDPGVLAGVLEGVVPAAKAKSERQQSNRHAVMDLVAGRWVERGGGRLDGWSLLESVTWYLDRRRRASAADREDQSVDDSGWVTRAKFVAHGALSGKV